MRSCQLLRHWHQLSRVVELTAVWHYILLRHSRISNAVDVTPTSWVIKPLSWVIHRQRPDPNLPRKSWYLIKIMFLPPLHLSHDPAFCLHSSYTLSFPSLFPFPTSPSNNIFPSGWIITFNNGRNVLFQHNINMIWYFLSYLSSLLFSSKHGLTGRWERVDGRMDTLTSTGGEGLVTG